MLTALGIEGGLGKIFARISGRFWKTVSLVYAEVQTFTFTIQVKVPIHVALERKGAIARRLVAELLLQLSVGGLVNLGHSHIRRHPKLRCGRDRKHRVDLR